MNNPHNPIQASYELEKKLEQSIDKMRDNITKSHQLKKELIKARKQRRQIEKIPDEVKQWFEETEEFLEDEDL